MIWLLVLSALSGAAGVVALLIDARRRQLRIHYNHESRLQTWTESMLSAMWHSGPYTRALQNAAAEQAQEIIGSCPCRSCQAVRR
jgi:hypothetical protein